MLTGPECSTCPVPATTQKAPAASGVAAAAVASSSASGWRQPKFVWVSRERSLVPATAADVSRPAPTIAVAMPGQPANVSELPGTCACTPATIRPPTKPSIASNQPSLAGPGLVNCCLLYTSDAADDLLCVD